MSAYGNTSDFPFSEGIFTSEPWQLAVTSILVVVLTALASAAGIGGGGLVVPVYTYVMATGVYYASPLSTATILGVAIGKNVISIQRRHPDLVRPLINYDLATYIQMTVLLGTIIGVILHGILPEIVVTIILALVLGYSGVEAMRKGVSMSQKEAVERQSAIVKAVEGLNDETQLETMRASPRADHNERGFYTRPAALLEMTKIEGTDSSSETSTNSLPGSPEASTGADVVEKRELDDTANTVSAVEDVVVVDGVHVRSHEQAADRGNVGDSGGEHDPKGQHSEDSIVIAVGASEAKDDSYEGPGSHETKSGPPVKDPLSTPPRQVRYKKQMGDDASGSGSDGESMLPPIVTPSSAVRTTHDTNKPKDQESQLVRFRKQFKAPPDRSPRKRERRRSQQIEEQPEDVEAGGPLANRAGTSHTNRNAMGLKDVATSHPAVSAHHNRVNDAATPVSAAATPSKQREAVIERKILDLFNHERRCFWWENWLTLGVVTAFMLIYSLVKSEIIFIWPTCDTAWWIWYVIPAIVIPLVQYAFSLNLLKWQNKKIDCFYDFQKFEVQFTIAKLRCISVAGLAAGSIASLVGVGGGMVIGPLLLKLKMQPSESSATSGFMMVFTALSGTIQYISNSSIRWDFLLWFLVAGAGGGIVGELVVKEQIQKLGR
eukprot:INCI13115.3.p1 GENE.INCI13115.3~~INCI13115.3.p1  ORF type:complete len:661 (-),score=83.93 INCI13115.3:369-2351(-)